MNYKDILSYTRTKIAMNILRAASMNVLRGTTTRFKSKEIHIGFK